MSTERNARPDDGFDLRDLIQPSFEFDGVGTGLDELARTGHGLRGGVVGVDWQVRDHHRPRDGTTHNRGMIDHLLQCHRCRVLVSGDHHAERIPYQNQLDAGFVTKSGGRVVVGGDRRNRPGESRGWGRESEPLPAGADITQANGRHRIGGVKIPQDLGKTIQFRVN